MPKIVKKKEIRLQIKGVDNQKPNLTFRTKDQRNNFKRVAKRLIQSLRGDMEFLPQDITWVNRQSEHTKNQLRQLGVTLRTESKESYRLEKVVTDYVRGIDDLSATTWRYYNATAKRLVEFFGADFDVRNMSKSDAKDYVKYLVNDLKLNPNSTARRQTQYASTMLAKAVEDGLIDRNPFPVEGDKKNVLSDKTKIFYLSSEVCLKNLECSEL